MEKAVLLISNFFSCILLQSISLAVGPKKRFILFLCSTITSDSLSNEIFPSGNFSGRPAKIPHRDTPCLSLIC